MYELIYEFLEYQNITKSGQTIADDKWNEVSIETLLLEFLEYTKSIDHDTLVSAIAKTLCECEYFPTSGHKNSIDIAQYLCKEIKFI